MNDKLLAEWFWTDRWMGSSAFLLPQEARGVYREMLTQAWRRGARLPNDHEAIRRATGTTEQEWARSWPQIKRYWRVDGISLVNDTQLEVFAEARQAQERAQARAQAGAQASAEARRTRKLKESSPSPSPSLELSPDNGSFERVPPRENPFVKGRRVELETEALKLCRELAELRGTDPAEEFADAADYKGAQRRKVNPASMTDDRLQATVLDLRTNLGTAKASKERQRIEQLKSERPTP